MAKKGIHPDLYEIEYTLTNGEKMKVKSPVNKSQALDADRYNHPAWTKEYNVASSTAGKVVKFNKKFGSIF